MREQRFRHSNLQPYIRTADAAGNPFFVSLFGLASLQSRALAGEDLLALRYSDYLCGWHVNHHQRVREDELSAVWRRFADEQQLSLQGLGEELLHLATGESIVGDIAGIIGRCHTDARFSPSWGNRKHLAPQVVSLHGKFSAARLPHYREAIAQRAESFLERAEHALRHWGIRVREEHGWEAEARGYEAAMEALSALAEEAEQKREELTRTRGELAAKMPQAVGRITDAAGAWWRLIGRREAVEEALGEAFRLMGEAWRVEVTLVAVEELRRILRGFEDDEGRVVKPGLTHLARRLHEEAAQAVKQWREREGEFRRVWKAELQRLKSRALDFEAVLDAGLLEAERLEESFTARITSPGVVAESLERLGRFLRSTPSWSDVKEFLCAESRRTFAGVLGGSLEEEVMADTARLQEVRAAVRKSRPLGSLKEDVLKRGRISRQERSLTIITVADPDHSAIKQALAKTVEGVTDDCFVAGPQDRLIALQEFWGLPVYALSSFAKYRDAYHSCLRNPAERSLHAAPRASIIPELEEPSIKRRQKPRKKTDATYENGRASHEYPGEPRR